GRRLAARGGRRKRWIAGGRRGARGPPPIPRSPARAALMTFLAFLLCGSIPLLPFIAGAPAAISVSTVMTGATFFLIGSLRSRWSPAPWWRSGLETFLIGICAAVLAYLTGVAVAALVGQIP